MIPLPDKAKMDFHLMMPLVTTVLAISAAIFHGWIFLLRRSERIHLWFALGAAAMASSATTACSRILYPEFAASPAAQCAHALATLLFMFSLLRFSCELRKIEVPDSVKAFDMYVLLTVAAGAAVLLGAPLSQLDFFLPGPPDSILSIADAIPFIPLFLAGVYCTRILLRDPEPCEISPKMILLSLGICWASGLSDIAVGAGLYHFPLLTYFGYSATILFVSALIMRPFVDSVTALEDQSDNLSALVDERTRELRQLDIQIVQSEKLAAIGTLAAGVAHEINNPMAYLSSNLNHLEQLCKTPENLDEAFEIIAECREGVDHVQKIVKDLTNFSSPASNDVEQIDFCEITRSVVRMIRHKAHYKADLIQTLEPVPFVHGDGRLFRQVLLNLLINALQAFPDNDIEKNKIIVSTEECDGEVLLHVSDNGVGISDEMLTRIFDPFFTTKDPTQGTGLGLNISYRIVQRFGGDLRVETSQTGTRFSIAMPLNG